MCGTSWDISGAGHKTVKHKTALNMEHIDVSNQSLAAQEAEINRFVIRTTDLKDPCRGHTAVKKKKVFG